MGSGLCGVQSIADGGVMLGHLANGATELVYGESLIGWGFPGYEVHAFGELSQLIGIDAVGLGVAALRFDKALSAAWIDDHQGNICMPQRIGKVEVINAGGLADHVHGSKQIQPEHQRTMSRAIIIEPTALRLAAGTGKNGDVEGLGTDIDTDKSDLIEAGHDEELLKVRYDRHRLPDLATHVLAVL